MSKIDKLAGYMQRLGELGPPFAASIEHAAVTCDSPQFREDANALLRQLTGNPGAGAVEAMRDAPQDLTATTAFLDRWRKRQGEPGFSEVLRCAEATEGLLREFNDVLSSLSARERAKAENTARLGRAMLNLFRPPRRPRLFALGLTIFDIGVIAGIVFTLAVGTGSSEFRNYFPYFLAAYAIGMLLTLAGK